MRKTLRLRNRTALKPLFARGEAAWRLGGCFVPDGVSGREWLPLEAFEASLEPGEVPSDALL